MSTDEGIRTLATSLRGWRARPLHYIGLSRGPENRTQTTPSRRERAAITLDPEVGAEGNHPAGTIPYAWAQRAVPPYA
jgi:hypothetical protein